MAYATLHSEVHNLEEALEDESTDLFVDLGLPHIRKALYDYLWNNRDVLATEVAKHMNASRPPRCEVPAISEWLPIRVLDHPTASVMMRFPLPYKCGEHHIQGRMDEKLCSEAATYAWLDEHCPEVPKPQLLGYSFSDGKRFNLLDNMPFATKVYESLRRFLLKLTGRPVPSRYVPQGKSLIEDIGYLLLENARKYQVVTLYETWTAHHRSPEKRKNLCRDLSDLILAIGKKTSPRIGSLTIDRRGYLNVENRPLTATIAFLENYQVDIGMKRSDTYTDGLLYALDLLGCQKEAFQQLRNAIMDENDGRLKMATLVGMQTVLPHFFPKSTRGGPFTLRLTDIHLSNLFVDEDWHIKSVIDLKFAAFLPREMELAPYWLYKGADQGVWDLSVDVDRFNAAHEEFLTIFQEQEGLSSSTIPRADAIQKAWVTGGFFYYHSLRLGGSCIGLFHRQVLPSYEPEFAFSEVLTKHLMPLWSMDSQQVLEKKVQDKREYDLELKDLFTET